MKRKGLLGIAVKFALAGSAGVITGWTIQVVLTSGFGIPYYLSALMGYGCGFLVNLWGNLKNGNITR